MICQVPELGVWPVFRHAENTIYVAFRDNRSYTIKYKPCAKGGCMGEVPTLKMHTKQNTYPLILTNTPLYIYKTRLVYHLALALEKYNEIRTRLT